MAEPPSPGAFAPSLLIEFHARAALLLSSLQSRNAGVSTTTGHAASLPGMPPSPLSPTMADKLHKDREALVVSVIGIGKRLVPRLDPEPASRLRHFLLRLAQETVAVRRSLQAQEDQQPNSPQTANASSPTSPLRSPNYILSTKSSSEVLRDSAAVIVGSARGRPELHSSAYYYAEASFPVADILRTAITPHSRFIEAEPEESIEEKVRKWMGEAHPYEQQAVDAKWVPVLVMAAQVAAAAQELMEELEASHFNALAAARSLEESGGQTDEKGQEELDGVDLAEYVDSKGQDDGTPGSPESLPSRPLTTVGMGSNRSQVPSKAVQRSFSSSSTSSHVAARKLRLTSTRSWSPAAFGEADEATLRTLCSLETCRTFLSGLRSMLSVLAQKRQTDVLLYQFGSWVPSDQLPEIKPDPFIEPQAVQEHQQHHLKRMSLFMQLSSSPSRPQSHLNSEEGETRSRSLSFEGSGSAATSASSSVEDFGLTGRTPFATFVKRFVALFGKQMVGLLSCPPSPGATVLTSGSAFPLRSLPPPLAPSHSITAPSSLANDTLAGIGSSPERGRPISMLSKSPHHMIPLSSSPLASSSHVIRPRPNSTILLPPAAPPPLQALPAPPPPSAPAPTYALPPPPPPLVDSSTEYSSRRSSRASQHRGSRITSTLSLPIVSDPFPPKDMWPALLRWRSKRFLSSGRELLKMCLDATSAATQLRARLVGKWSWERLPSQVQALVQIVRVLDTLCACVQTLADATVAGNQGYSVELQRAVEQVIQESRALSTGCAEQCGFLIVLFTTPAGRKSLARGLGEDLLEDEFEESAPSLHDEKRIIKPGGRVGADLGITGGSGGGGNGEAPPRHDLGQGGSKRDGGQQSTRESEGQLNKAVSPESGRKSVRQKKDMKRLLHTESLYGVAQSVAVEESDLRKYDAQSFAIALEDWDPGADYKVRVAVLRKGDVIAVTKIMDGMCEGVNLTTGGSGIFPRHLVSFVKKVIAKPPLSPKSPRSPKSQTSGGVISTGSMRNRGSVPSSPSQRNTPVESSSGSIRKELQSVPFGRQGGKRRNMLTDLQRTQSMYLSQDLRGNVSVRRGKWGIWTRCDSEIQKNALILHTMRLCISLLDAVVQPLISKGDTQGLLIEVPQGNIQKLKRGGEFRSLDVLHADSSGVCGSSQLCEGGQEDEDGEGEGEDQQEEEDEEEETQDMEGGGEEGAEASKKQAQEGKKKLKMKTETFWIKVKGREQVQRWVSRVVAASVGGVEV